MSYQSDLAEFTYDELNRYKEAGFLGKLSERADIDYKSLVEWASGRRHPTTASMEKVLDAMGYKIVIRRKNPDNAWW